VDEALHFFEQAAAGSALALPLSAIAVVIPGSPASDNQAILDARRSFAESQFPQPAPVRSPRRAKADHQPLRIGYVSSFFQDRNWMKPVWGLINHHDRRKFEIHLFSDSPVSRIQHGYRSDPQDRFHDISRLSNHALAREIETVGIDLLVDLNGYSRIERLPLFVQRPAPVIVGWFNMFATTGMSSYDYLIGDDIVIPPVEEQYYCEKILRVAGSYLTFEVDYPVPDVADPPCLGKGAITFGCMASQYKITNQVIEAFSEILRRVPESSLILKNGAQASTGARDFVHALFEQHQVSPSRVRLEGPSDHYRFLQTYSEIDIALDTFPYNGGTTTTEAIWQACRRTTWVGAFIRAS